MMEGLSFSEDRASWTKLGAQNVTYERHPSCRFYIDDQIAGHTNSIAQRIPV